MPSTYAHYRMGQEVYKKLKGEEKRVVEAKKELFDIGLHGPDILFYYKPLFMNGINQVGYGMHAVPGMDFFKKAAGILESSRDRKACRAYIYGFICHFALDVTCHGYIDEKIAASGISHTEIEVEFDRELMIMDGYEPVTHNLTGHIHATKENAEVIQNFFAGVSSIQVQKALEGMISYNKLLIAPSRIKRCLIYALLKATGNYKEMHGLLVNYEKNPMCEDSNKKLMELYMQAEILAVRLIEDYMDSARGIIPYHEKYHYTFGSQLGGEYEI